MYNGPSSVDHVYVDPDFYAWAEPDVLDYANDLGDFDQLEANHAMVFTFLIDPVPADQIISAYLTIAMRATDGLVFNDRIDLESDRGPWDDSYRNGFSDLGWLPISSSGTTIRTLDLSNVRGFDYRPFLSDGKFNVMVHDDESIDYAELTVTTTGTVVPLPPAVWLGVVGLGMVGWIKRRRKGSAEHLPNERSLRIWTTCTRE